MREGEHDVSQVNLQVNGGNQIEDFFCKTSTGFHLLADASEEDSSQGGIGSHLWVPTMLYVMSIEVIITHNTLINRDRAHF